MDRFLPHIIVISQIWNANIDTVYDTTYNK